MLDVFSAAIGKIWEIHINSMSAAARTEIFNVIEGAWNTCQFCHCFCCCFIVIVFVMMIILTYFDPRLSIWSLGSWLPEHLPVSAFQWMRFCNW